jgi:hypothetical protein
MVPRQGQTCRGYSYVGPLARIAAWPGSVYLTVMPDFLIERIMPGVEQLSLDDLKQSSRMGMAVLRDRFPAVQWLRSYATKDILYCVYCAPDETTIRDYATGSALPVHRISEVRATLDPDTIEPA